MRAGEGERARRPGDVPDVVGVSPDVDCVTVVVVIDFRLCLDAMIENNQIRYQIYST